MDGHHRHMAASEDGDPAFAPVLEHRQFLGERVKPVKSRKI
jgi:hypothetical protein